MDCWPDWPRSRSLASGRCSQSVPIATALAGAGIGAAAGGLIGGLTEAGVPEHHAEYYAEGVRRGGVLVTVRTTDALAERAADILDIAGATDVDERAAEWRSSGWTPKYTGNIDKDRKFEGERKMDVVQEDIHIGKREVGRRAVRIYSEVTEKPVEKQVNLREEKIRVDRQPVNREARPGEIDTFKEGQIELTEKREEPVVNKTARVVEEVRVGKDVNERTETVRDTVRRKDVRVEETGGTHADYDEDFRTDYQKRYANRGQSYDYYAPAYRFGSTYATDQRYRDRDWNIVESDLRRDWESSRSGQMGGLQRLHPIRMGSRPRPPLICRSQAVNRRRKRSRRTTPALSYLILLNSFLRYSSYSAFNPGSRGLP